MTERPILFSAPMVRAILAGTKTQTRRAIKFKPWHQIEERDDGTPWPWMQSDDNDAGVWLRCPYGVPGDRLWVRETHALKNRYKNVWCEYAADGHRAAVPAPEFVTVSRPGMRPSIHMPRWASRITLQITDVRVEQLQDISEPDAIAEGVTEHQTLDGRRSCNIDGGPMMACGPIPAYRALWEQINGPESWDENPWVWVVEFRRAET
jgi:hypothetical protein